MGPLDWSGTLECLIRRQIEVNNASMFCKMSHRRQCKCPLCIPPPLFFLLIDYATLLLFSSISIPQTPFSLFSSFLLHSDSPNFKPKDRIQQSKQTRMVDRYQSLLGSEILSDNIDRNMKVDRAFNTNMEMIKRANERAAKMRQFISKYKRDISADADQYVKQFKIEQREYAKDRNYLKTEVDKLEKAKKKDSSQYNFIKKELIKAVKSELDLQFQLNQEITRRKEEKELLKRQLFEGSVQIQNAVRDIQAKKEDILYLQRLINQCVQLLEIIGVLVHENGEKINEISREVECANENAEKAERNIDKARIAMQKSRCKWCCVLFIAIVVIVLGVIVYVTSVK